MRSYLRDLKNKLFFLGSISPLDCLVRKIDTKNLTQELSEDYRNFYLSSSDSEIDQCVAELTENIEWKKFISELINNDELWFFNFPKKYWKKLEGMQGYVIIRYGKMIKFISTIRN